jgi:type II secretory ATPase GspE/PulE/Tfp pilus assembly ATPase PilB-like protein
VPLPHRFDSAQQRLSALNSGADSYAADFVDALLNAAQELDASDVHLRPTEAGLDIAVRIDGVLQNWGVFPGGKVSDVITRLKVLAELLTYRTDVPQEGRLRNPSFAAEVRVSSFPTLHGEKVVVRLFAAEAYFPYVESLGLPEEIQNRLLRLLDETAGAIVITGPAGSGKTTTAYACVREIVRRTSGGRSVATLEDPVEIAIPGAAQTQVNARAGFDLAAGLRSLLRQDPEVILVGEMRDPATAGIALQASLTGQLVLTTFHASSAAGAISRLLDMGLEPYVLRSGILAVISQRLVRKLCNCAHSSDSPDAKLGLPVAHAKVAHGCDRCHGTGYHGRMLLAEMLTIDSPAVAAGILARHDAGRLEQAAIESGMATRWNSACYVVAAGLTSAAEVRRVLGVSAGTTDGDL